MTIKELANFTARTERTVRRWINKAELSSDTLTAKMSDAMNKNKPSDYTLDETEQILRCSSLPKIVVDGLMQNARQESTVIATNKADNPSIMMAQMFQILMDQQQKQQEQNQMFMTTVLSEIKNISQPLQIEAPKEDYFSLVAYCSLNHIKTNRSELAMHGRELRKMAVSKGLELKKIPDERWGEVNSYPVEILTEYFAV